MKKIFVLGLLATATALLTGCEPPCRGTWDNTGQCIPPVTQTGNSVAVANLNTSYTRGQTRPAQGPYEANHENGECPKGFTHVGVELPCMKIDQFQSSGSTSWSVSQASSTTTTAGENCAVCGGRLHSQLQDEAAMLYFDTMEIYRFYTGSEMQVPSIYRTQGEQDYLKQTMPNRAVSNSLHTECNAFDVSTNTSVRGIQKFLEVMQNLRYQCNGFGMLIHSGGGAHFQIKDTDGNQSGYSQKRYTVVAEMARVGLTLPQSY